MKSKILICGDFYGIKVTGIQRVAIEILNELDKIIQPDEVYIAVPNNVDKMPKYNNIKVIPIHAAGKSIHLWIQLHFGIYAKKNKFTTFTFNNESIILCPGIGYIHDLYYLLYPQDFIHVKDKIMKLVVKIWYKTTIKKAKKVITITETVKKEILSNYRVSSDKISVVGNGWQHVKNMDVSESLLAKYNLERDNFFFTLGSLELRKNIQWIIEYAEKNPDQIFALSGRMKADNEIAIRAQKCKNIVLCGYLSDEEMVTMFKTCKAFVFPSRYEGFGIPPLEAMAMGTKKIVLADIPSLREIYQDAVYYIDPYNTDIDINDVLTQSLKMTNEEILNKYSWKKSAELILEIIRS